MSSENIKNGTTVSLCIGGLAVGGFAYSTLMEPSIPSYGLTFFLPHIPNVLGIGGFFTVLYAFFSCLLTYFAAAFLFSRLLIFACEKIASICINQPPSVANENKKNQANQNEKTTYADKGRFWGAFLGGVIGFDLLSYAVISVMNLMINPHYKQPLSIPVGTAMTAFGGVILFFFIVICSVIGNVIGKKFDSTEMASSNRNVNRWG